MIVNEQQIAIRVRQVLSRGAQQLGPKIAERLRAGRERALAVQRVAAPVAARVPLVPTAGASDTRPPSEGGFLGLSVRLAGALLLVFASAFSLYSWQQEHQIAELEEVDAQLLANDLPIDAYLDEGFKHWLKTSARSE
jgi:hypothetical protein